ncbi:MAG: HAD family hydrolase [Firmicutes bacterium]|nr:HAD family hydrolase [Bacillota bacterium]
MSAPFIFFDIGSTLMDGPPVSPPSRFEKELNLPGGSSDLIENILFTEDITSHEALTHRFSQAFPELTPDAGEIIKNIWNAQIEEGWEVAGARETLNMFLSSGWRIGIISNIWHPYFQCFKRLYGDMLPHFESMILSYKAGCRKPGQNIYKKALTSINASEHEDGGTHLESITMVGDSYTQDILPSLNLGMKTVWFLREHEREADNLKKIILGHAPLPTIAVSDLKELSGRKLEYLKTEFSVLTL